MNRQNKKIFDSIQFLRRFQTTNVTRKKCLVFFSLGSFQKKWRFKYVFLFPPATEARKTETSRSLNNRGGELAPNCYWLLNLHTLVGKHENGYNSNSSTPKFTAAVPRMFHGETLLRSEPLYRLVIHCSLLVSAKRGEKNIPLPSNKNINPPKSLNLVVPFVHRLE